MTSKKQMFHAAFQVAIPLFIAALFVPMWRIRAISSKMGSLYDSEIASGEANPVTRT